MRGLLLFTIAAFASAAQPDPKELVTKAVQAAENDWRALRTYSYVQRDEEQHLDSNGKVKSTTIETTEVAPLDGVPYERVVQRDDKPLPAHEQSKVQTKFQKELAEDRSLSPEQKKKRRAEYERKHNRDLAFLKEVPNAFNFKIVGEENVNGRPAYVIQATPRPGYQPKDRYSKMFPKVRGKMWVDKQDAQMAKVEAEVMDNISFGLFMARIGKGGRIHFEQTRINEKVWLPKFLSAKMTTRMFLVKNNAVNETVTYKGYKKAPDLAQVAQKSEP
jgi:hypothetical protein